MMKITKASNAVSNESMALNARQSEIEFLAAAVIASFHKDRCLIVQNTPTSRETGFLSRCCCSLVDSLIIREVYERGNYVFQSANTDNTTNPRELSAKMFKSFAYRTNTK